MAHQMLRAGGASIPRTYDDERPVCGRCPRCHPGKNWGGDEACKLNDCTCHRGGTR